MGNKPIMGCKRLLGCLTAACCFAYGKPSAFAASADGGQPGYFMAQGIGARPLGMGGAYVGLAEDVSSIYWNPAGLSQLNRYEVQMMRSILYENTNFDSAGFAGKVPLFSDLFFGIGAMQIASSDFTRRDSNNNPIGTFSNTNRAAIVSLAKPIAWGLVMGLSGRFMSESVDDWSKSAYDYDLGFMFRPMDFSNSKFLVSAGAVFRNMYGAAMERENLTDTAPHIISVGSAVGYKLANSGRFVVTADMDKSAAQADRFRAGTEFTFYDLASLRAGIDDGNMTFGGGISIGKSLQLDYAAINKEDLGSSSKFSLTMRFGQLTRALEECGSKCREEYGKAENRYHSCARNEKRQDCDVAINLIDTYLSENTDGKDKFSELRNKCEDKKNELIKGNAVFVCNVEFAETLRSAEWSVDLRKEFKNYEAEKSVIHLVEDSRFNVCGADTPEKIKHKFPEVSILQPSVKLVGSRYTLATEAADSTGRNARLEVAIDETDPKQIDFRKYARELVKKFMEWSGK
ncbi:MAG: hypothetical protein WC421_07745 [Elusimicrobiales bacterium]